MHRQDAWLAALREVNVSNSVVNSAQLAALVIAAPSLEVLDATNCARLDDRHVQSFFTVSSCLSLFFIDFKR